MSAILKTEEQVTAASFMQVLLLVRQIDYSNARTSAVKVSLLTIGQQAVMDSYLCLMHLTTGIVVEALFNAFATAAFFKFMIFSIFEMRYLLMIWKARRPHGFQEGWNSMRRELSMLYSRFYGCLLAGIVLIYQLQRFSGVLVLLLYSFWVPQIVHNIHHDHRKPLLIRYTPTHTTAHSPTRARTHTTYLHTHTTHSHTNTPSLFHTHTHSHTYTHSLSLHTHTLSLTHTHTNNHSRTPWLAHVVFVEAPVCSSFNGMSPFEDIL